MNPIKSQPTHRRLHHHFTTMKPPPPEEQLHDFQDIVVFQDEEDDEEEEKQVDYSSPSSSEPDEKKHQLNYNNNNNTNSNQTNHPHHHPDPTEEIEISTNFFINPEPHISAQFYTFTHDSHALMVRCIVEQRLAAPEEIRRTTPPPVLRSWRSVWKDRNEDTAYVTAWKRIRDKLGGHVDEHGNGVLYFKNNSQQYVSYVDQWQDIVVAFHADGDLRHLAVKETIDRIKQVWTVGAKFYGIPESFIRACVAACPDCNGASGSGLKSKRRRFEYTETFDVPAKEVPHKLQQLAVKHKVVLCIRQKYIRYKPFMAEVKDYACHRAGEPTAKKAKVSKREPYASKRCGCGFRIRAIVPIANYNEKDKSFVYQEEGTAVFKLYAIHTGHEPGPLDGNARIVHRVVGHKGGEFLLDQDTIYGMNDEMETDAFGFMGKDDGDSQLSVLHQIQELKVELGMLEDKLVKMPQEHFGSVSRELFDIVNRIRSIREDTPRSVGVLHSKPLSEDVLGGESELAHWNDQHDQMYGDGKDTELIEEDDDSFGSTLGDVVPWDRMRTESRSRKVLITENLKSDKWLKDPCHEFDGKNVLDCEDSKLIKPIRHDGDIVPDAALVGIQVDGFYQDNSKWYDSHCGLDPGADCGDTGFRPG